MDKDTKRTPKTVSRRLFLKLTGAGSAVAGLAGTGLWGYQNGRDPQTYTGCEGFQGAAQSFNRDRFAVDKPHYDIVGPTSRADARTEMIFNRIGRATGASRSGEGIEGLE